MGKAPVLQTGGPKFHSRSHNENKKHGEGDTLVITVLARQRQADPWAVWLACLAHMVHSRPKTVLVSKTNEVDGP